MATKFRCADVNSPSLGTSLRARRDEPARGVATSPDIRAARWRHSDPESCAPDSIVMKSPMLGSIRCRTTWCATPWISY